MHTAQYISVVLKIMHLRKARRNALSLTRRTPELTDNCFADYPTLSEILPDTFIKVDG